jgi:spore coat protein U-like protein
MSKSRSLLVAIVAVALLIGARPFAGDKQFPRGLMSAAPRGGGQGGECRIETRPLSFGAYDTLAGADVDAVGEIIYVCQGNNGGGGGGGGGGGRGGGPDGRGGGPGAGTRAQNTGIRIELSEGGNNSFDPRGMIGPGLRVLEYNIYLDATRRTIWGTGIGSTEVYLDLNPPTDTPVVVPLYGRIFGRQHDELQAGSYQDTVPVRIQF